MRRLRDALMISGLARSFGVIELMMPSMRRDLPCRPCRLRLRELPASCAGSLSISAAMPPILLICADLLLEVLEVEALALLHLLRRASAPPRRRPARAPPRPATARRPCRGCARPCARDGTASRPASFSPDADELDRLAGDVAHRQRRAAARIAVELGEHDAGQRQRVAERLRATLTASWPCIASTTNSVSIGCKRARAASRSRCIIASSIARRPAVSTISTSW